MGKVVIVKTAAQYSLEIQKLLRQLGSVGSEICNKAGEQSKNWIKTYLRINKVFESHTLITSIKAGHKYLSSRVYIESPADKYAAQIDHKAGLVGGGMWMIFDNAKFEKSKVQGVSQFAQNPAELLHWVIVKDNLPADKRVFFLRVGAVRVGAGHRGIYAGRPQGLKFMEKGFGFATDPKKLTKSYYKALNKYGLSGGVSI